MANIEELQRTMTEILDHPESHDQSLWACGSTGCFAGLTAMRHGWREAMSEQLDGQPSGSGHMVHRDWAQSNHVQPIAKAILDLTDEEAERLFFHTTTVEMLEQMVKDLANGEDLHNLWPRQVQAKYKNGVGVLYTKYIRRKEAHDHP